MAQRKKSTAKTSGSAFDPTDTYNTMPSGKGPFKCYKDDCDFTSKSPQGLGSHYGSNRDHAPQAWIDHINDPTTKAGKQRAKRKQDQAAAGVAPQGRPGRPRKPRRQFAPVSEHGLHYCPCCGVHLVGVAVALQMQQPPVTEE